MKRNFSKVDKILLVLTVIFIIFGLIMVLSASSMESYMRRETSPYYYFIRQALFMGIGIILYFIITRIPLRTYKKFSILLMVLAILSLGGLITYGYVAGNASSWFKIGPFSIQPSEFAKLIIIIFIASYYDKNNDLLNTQWVMIKPMLLVLPIVFLVALQPDIGTAAIIGLIAFFMFFSVPMSRKVRKKFNLISIGGILVILLVLLATGGSFLKSYQLKRLVNFMNPCDRYQEDTGYQVCNSFIAFTNGGMTGEGIGNSTQKYLYLPESYTDFIFPIIVEEWGGFIGILIVIFYMIIIYRLYVIARRANNLNGSLIAYGVCIYFFLHVAINLVGVMGLGPLTGVPLPFLSYGGSYTISLLCAMGLSQRVAIESNIDKEKRAKKLKKAKKSLA